jgi:hypothetical protein
MDSPAMGMEKDTARDKGKAWDPVKVRGTVTEITRELVKNNKIF